VIVIFSPHRRPGRSLIDYASKRGWTDVIHGGLENLVDSPTEIRFRIRAGYHFRIPDPEWNSGSRN
jgi:hypothetical protein